MTFIMICTFAFSAGTKVIRDEKEEDFQKGELKSTSLSSDGFLTIAPGLKSISATGEPVVWDVLQSGPSIYSATGHEGKVFRQSGETSPTLVCDLKEVEATALAMGPNQDLFVGASPGGRIYRVHGNDKVTSFSSTHQAYVWDLLAARDGNLYAACGMQGNIYKIEKNGKVKLFFETKAANVLALAELENGTLLAATEQPGMVFAFARDGSQKILLDATPYDEIKCIIPGANGSIYAILNGGGQETGAKPNIEALRAALGSLTGGEAGKQPPTAPTRPIAAGAAKSLESQIVKINANGFVQTIWFSPDPPIHSLYYDKERERLYAGVGEKGLLFEISEDGKYSRILQAPQRSIMTLGAGKDGLLLGTAEGGYVYQMRRSTGSAIGIFLSQALDAGDPVQWGNLRIKSSETEGTSITLAVRQGNSSEPDDRLWSHWTEEKLPLHQYVHFSLTPSRYIQYRATLSRSLAATTSPVIDTVEAFYAPSNLSPVIKNVTVGPPARKGAVAGANQQNILALLMSGQGKPTGDSEAEQSTGGELLAREPNSNAKGVQIAWEIEEPNEDKFEVDVFFKGENENTWKKINKEPVRDKAELSWTTATIPDGEYRVKIVASDVASNPENKARKSEKISERFTVDNSTPVLRIDSAIQENGLHVRVQAFASDATSGLADAKYNIDSGDWQLLNPVDDVFDSPEEQFDFNVKLPSAGEHVITVLVTDREGNTELAKQVVNVTEH